MKLHVEVENWEGYLSCEVPPEEWGVWAPHQAFQLGASVPEKEVTITSGYENQQSLWLSETEGWEVTVSLLEVSCTDQLANRFISSETQHWGNSLKGTWDIWEKMNCLASGQSLEGQIFPKQKCWQKLLFLCWSLHQPNTCRQSCHHMSLYQLG